MEKHLDVINLPALTLPKVGPLPKMQLKNVKIRLTGGTFEASFPLPRVSLNFEVIEYESKNI